MSPASSTANRASVEFGSELNDDPRGAKWWVDQQRLSCKSARSENSLRAHALSAARHIQQRFTDFNLGRPVRRRIVSQETWRRLMQSSDSVLTSYVGPGPRTLMPEIGSGDDESALWNAVAELFHALSNTLLDDKESAESRLRRVADLLDLAPMARSNGSAMPMNCETAADAVRGGLAPWQIRAVKTHVELNLAGNILTGDLAEVAKLSPFHFCRAFRESFGTSPHTYVMQRKIERAQGLMLKTDAALSQIALECGLADQAHLNKLFRKLVGQTPAAWRRARTEASSV
jgi:AraC family transcriptional regulator